MPVRAARIERRHRVVRSRLSYSVYLVKLMMHEFGNTLGERNRLHVYTNNFNGSIYSLSSRHGSGMLENIKVWLQNHEETQVMFASVLVLVGLWWLVRTILVLLMSLVCPVLVVFLAVASFFLFVFFAVAIASALFKWFGSPPIA